MIGDVRDTEHPDIDFARIRPYGQAASRSSAFEELSSILIEQGAVNWPSGVRFERFGNPDGGREGRGILPNGDVWAWQSKYLFEFDASAAGQVSSSVSRVLGREPKLRKYFVTLPIDLPAGDTERKGSAHTRWVKKAEEWIAEAGALGMDVEFVFVGAHELVTALTEPRHAGRAHYWFETEVLTPQWQVRRLEESVAKAGRRYTPELHIDVEPAQTVLAAGRSKEYTERWRLILTQLREARRWPWHAPKADAEAFGTAVEMCGHALDAADAALVEMIEATRSTAPLPVIDQVLRDAALHLNSVEDLLHQHSLTDDRHFVDDAATLFSAVRRSFTAIDRAERLAASEATKAARDGFLLVSGRAGTGKTHLLCDIATRRATNGSPTIFLFGQDFDNGALLPQVAALSQVSNSLDGMLSVLDAAAEAAGDTGLVLLDALNESEKPERWKDDLPALIAAAARHRHVAIVATCRTEFVDAVVGDVRVAGVAHTGFASETIETAVRRFTESYGLEPPTFPVLNPEFSNPLYLKLTCEALATLGMNRFSFGSAGLDTVCGAFLEAVNRRLSVSARCDYDEHENLVGRAVKALAALRQDPMERSDVRGLTSELLPGRDWSRSLMNGLLAEGVLLALGDGRIIFGYQRLGDVAHATALAEKSVDEVRDWLQELGDAAWRHQGTLGALAVIMPERHQTELVDLARDHQGRVSYELIDAFLESLSLRAPESVSERTVNITRQLLDDPSRADDLWNRLLRIACLPAHPLNMDWLHAYLMAQDLAVRDQTWSARIVGALDEETAIAHLIRWAWPTDLTDRPSPPDDVTALAVKLFGWLLSTTDIRVRDQATKAIVSLGEQSPAGFATALASFHGTNDPYVVERLAAAACGVALRTQSSDGVRRVADGLLQLLGDELPTHLLIRDFARRVYGTARTHGWEGPRAEPPYGAAWPIPMRSYDEIKSLVGSPGSGYSSIWHSLSGWGDFSRYVLEDALRDIVCDDRKALQHDAERAIFDRVLELGWTAERFGEIDKRRSGLDNHKVERVGKKYQWIGFYETLGRITDHYATKPYWSDGDGSPYDHAEQLIWRDIDPTVLVRKPEHPPRVLPWFAPHEASFAEDRSTRYPDTMFGVPDPLDMIAVRDPDDERWLVLVSNSTWQEPLPPEVAVMRGEQRSVWMQIHGYLVRSDQVPQLEEWCKDKDWFGRWMPDVLDVHNTLLAAHPDGAGWDAADGDHDWFDGRDGAKPADFQQCAARYSGTGGSREASAEDETRGYVPSRALATALGLRRCGDFLWMDEVGLAVQDPSVRTGGTATLAVRRDLVGSLANSGLTLFWTVLTGSELHGDDIPDDDYRWVSASASYVLEGEQVKKIHGVANQVSPGSKIEKSLPWAVRSTDAG
jgi:hypothetical protein